MTSKVVSRAVRVKLSDYVDMLLFDEIVLLISRHITFSFSEYKLIIHVQFLSEYVSVLQI